MSDKLEKIYDTFVDGTEEGLTDKQRCPKGTTKKIVKPSLLALTDKELKNELLLRVIHDLAIKHRLDPATEDDLEEDYTARAPTLKVRKKGASNHAFVIMRS